MMKHNTIKSGCLAAAVMALSDQTQAYDLPTVNLGMTSFLDGGLPAGKGWYAQNYLQDYRSDQLQDAKGEPLALPKTDLHYQVLMTQLSYLSEIRVGQHGALGINFLLPMVSKMAVDDGLNHAALKAQSGFGDLMIGPFIQFDPIMGERGPKFVQRIEFQINLPTGDYSTQRDINPSNHAISFDPYWAASYWITPKWTVSTRLHYLYNFKNAEPSYAFADDGDLQAGQAVHANFATDYAVTTQLRLGISGYWLKQISDSKLNGQAMKDRREQVWAIGPGLMYSFSQHDHVVANAYWEHDAQNRPEGTRLQLRLIHHFHD
jgi:hypothetical protein